MNYLINKHNKQPQARCQPGLCNQMTIYLFGDSFSSNESYDLDWLWYNRVAHELSDNLSHHGIRGSSCQYLYQQFHDVHQEIQPQDLLIVCLPAFNRQWFFLDKPGASSLTTARRHGISAEQYGAVQQYYRHLYQDRVTEMSVLNFLYRLDSMVAATGCRALIIGCFKNDSLWLANNKPIWKFLHVAVGSLQEVSDGELGLDIDHPKRERLWFILDPRANHLCRINHKILSDKIMHWLLSSEQVNLNQGFETGLITMESLSNPQFLRTELKSS